ncbi:MAG: TonB-dependent receptor [Bacteroidota bacterium]|nr:TonB-dependent receptor [Bacteroidota bacterium]
MKKTYLLFIAAGFFLTVIGGFAQTVTVTDEFTKETVSDAILTAHLPAPNIRLWSAKTNSSGQADITTIANEDSLYVRHPKYGTQGYAMGDIKNNNYIVFLRTKSVTLDEVVFSASKTEEPKSDVPFSIIVVDAKDVNFSNPQTSADMLMNTGGVFVQKSQMGGGSPVLRGFEANKVLFVVDGVRMNNAIYRAGHTQDAITVDPNMLERTEVLFGPSSVIYGSDALGGTMQFYSRKPMLTNDTALFVASNAMLRTSTANDELTAHFDINFGGKKWASLTSVTRSDYGDLRQGAKGNPHYGNFGWSTVYVERIDGKDSVIRNNDPLVQRHTGYSQVDILQKNLFKQNNHVSHLLNFQMSTSSVIPRYDRYAQVDGNGVPVYAVWDYGPQNRMLVSYNLNLKADSSFYDEANIILSMQKIEQDRISRRLNSNNLKNQEEDVMVYGLNADFRKLISEKHELRYGLEVTYNDVQSTATSTNINTEAVTPTDTRYPDGGSTITSAAAYFSHTWEISPKLILSDGIRLSYIALKSTWADTSIFHLPFTGVEQSNIAPSGSIGLVYLPCAKFRLHVNGSTGFRAPNVDDMGKIFESAPGMLYVPNPNVKPEIAIGGEAGVEWNFTTGARLELVGFYTVLNNAIVTKAFQFNGQDSMVYDGTLSQVLAAQNANSAFVYGFTTGLSADFNAHFSFHGTVTYTYGRYKDEENDTLIPLDHIPPVFGQAGLVYHTKGFEAEFFTRFNGWKRLADYSPSGEDNLNQATAFGMPSWTTINFRATYNVNKYLGVNFAVENIMDINYRHFASGMSAPGRNFIFAMRLHF